MLNRNQSLSWFTISTINQLIEKGINFSYATARSYVTASKVTSGISLKIPVIVYNGALIIENGTQRRIVSNYFNENEVTRIKEILTKYRIFPIVYADLNNVEKYSFSNKHISIGMKTFLESRKGDIRENMVSSDYLYNGDIFYFTCIDDADKLFPVYNLLKDSFNCVYQKYIYSGDQWLEILPSKATKASGVLKLKELMNCNRVITFGDGKNDVSMFDISDECYAVNNADDELKQRATSIIDSNNDDGVARWLFNHVK